MFEREIAINEFLIESCSKILNDLPEDSLYQHFPGHGHSPVWILGHLALVGEMGQRTLGGSISHPQWLRLFGPGSVDQIAPNEDLNKSSLTASVVEGYRKFRELAVQANEEAMLRMHNIAIFNGSPIKTVGDCITHLLSSHFSFHLSQLSSCRRTGGHAYLF